MSISVLDIKKLCSKCCWKPRVYLNCVPCSMRILGGPRSLTRADCVTAGKPGTEALHEYRPVVVLDSLKLRKGPLLGSEWSLNFHV